MKIRNSGTRRDPMAKFQQADQMDAKSIRAFVNDPKSWNPLYLYHAPGVPTFAGAVLSAQEAKLSTRSSSRGGAGSHPESMVARGFAYRNAVRQMILSEG